MKLLAGVAVLFGLVPSLCYAQETGSGELWLHEDVWALYEAFESNDNRHYFAVSTNGLDAGYSFCPSGAMCKPLGGKMEAIRACNSSPSDLPGQCYIFANRNRVVWQGEVHVLSADEFLAHVYGPASIEEALQDYAGHVIGPAGDQSLPFKPTKAVWQRPDFAFPPAGFALQGEECRYAFEAIYRQAMTRNFFLADPSGRYCGFATGFSQERELEAFLAALAACADLAAAEGCVVYAASDALLAGLSRL